MPRTILILIMLIVSGHSCVLPENIRGYEDDEAYYIPGREKFWSPEPKRDSTNKGEDFYKAPQIKSHINSNTFLQNYYNPSPYWYPYNNGYYQTYSPPISLPSTQPQNQNVTHQHRPSIGSSSGGSINRGNPRNPSSGNRKNSNPPSTNPRK